MNAQEAAAISQKNSGNTPESQAYKSVMEGIKSQVSKGERHYNVTSLLAGTVSMLRHDGFRVEQGDGSVDPRDVICFTVRW